MKQVFSVYDSKAEFFAQPMFFRTTGEALRSWSQACNDEQQDLSKHPGDFSLFHIATYDTDTGVLTMLENGKVNYGTAIEQLSGDLTP